MKRLILLVFLTGCVTGLVAQVRLTGKESVEQRRRATLSLSPDPEKISAEQFAKEAGLPVRRVYPDGRVVEIRGRNPNGVPEYLTTHNLNAAKTISTQMVWEGGGAGYGLTGAGIVVGFWDGGVFRSTHVEFDERARIIDTQADTIGHATHVAGTVGAAGINARAKGMAGSAFLEGYDWDNDIREMGIAAGAGLLLSNHSYGYITGWDYNSERERWDWYGDVRLSREEDYLFGFYHRETQEYDRVAHENPYYLVVKSAGNDRGEGPSPGAAHYVFENGEWTLSTEVRQKDGGIEGFDSMGSVGNAKNILVVGAIQDLPDGYLGRENVLVTDFSTFGPTDDGRIKPDVVANGVALYSAWSGSDREYRNSSGTSMSAPGITGSLALLQELHFSLDSSYLTSAELKGLILHTADDAGNPGPDYKFGWGVMNTLSAADLLADPAFDHVRRISLAEDQQYSIRLFSEGTLPVKVTLCWTDPPGMYSEPELDPVNRILVNDLDLRLVREADGEVFRPWVLDPLHPDDDASTGDNRLDNVEQILLENPEKGFYTITVSHKESLHENAQDFGLVVSGMDEEYYASGLTELNGNNGEFILTSAPEYLPDMNAGWLIVPENNLPVRLYFDYFSTEPGNDRLFVYDGTDHKAPLLTTLEGTPDLETTEFISTSGALFLRFVSDEQRQDAGFRAVYCTVPPESTPRIQGEPYPCEGSESLYMASGVPGAGFIWTPPSGWSLQESGDRRIALSIGTGPGTLGVRPVNRCGEGRDTWLVLSPLDTVPFLYSYVADTVPCAGSATFAEVNSLPGAKYEWVFPGDWLGSSAENRLDYIPGRQSGTIEVNARNACGPGDTLRIPIAVKDVPEEIRILTTRESPCARSEQQFYVSAEPGHTYRWEAGEGWSILSDPGADTVLVAVGNESRRLAVDVTNKCGSTETSKLFTVSPAPDEPLVRVEKSEIEEYKLLRISNASSFTGFQWYRDNEEIPGSIATVEEYIAYLPGTYTVSVTNSAGCEYRQTPGEGIRIQQHSQLYNAYQGGDGKIVVINATNFSATANIYHYSGKLVKIAAIAPGYNEISFGQRGAYIISVTGPQNRRTIRLFTQ